MTNWATRLFNVRKGQANRVGEKVATESQDGPTPDAEFSTPAPKKVSPKAVACGPGLPSNDSTGVIENRPILAPEALYGLAGDVVRTLEPHTEADPAALLIQFLAAFGNCIGRKAYYQVEGDRHYPNLYAVLVGESSKARKGTSWGRIRTLFEHVDEVWAKEHVHSGLSTGEGLIWAVRDSISNQEMQGVDRSEPLFEDPRDSGISDKRLFVLESEFASILRVLTRQGNTLSRVIRDAWDRGELATMTKNSPARATDAHISIVGHITTDELLRYLDRTEAANGFANRFMYIHVARSKLLPFGSEVTKEELHPLIERLNQAIRLASDETNVLMTEDAKMIWLEVYGDLSEGQPGLYGAVTGRAEAQAIRLALIYALLDGSTHIKEPHLLAALALWDYSGSSSRLVFGGSLGNPDADKILAALQEGEQTRTDLLRAFGRHRTSEMAQALRLLLDTRRIMSEKRTTGGRPVEIFSLTSA